MEKLLNFSRTVTWNPTRVRVNELRRMAYLDALGIDSYISRSQLPGAAMTRRLAIISQRPRAVTAVTGDAPTRATSSLLDQPSARRTRDESDTDARNERARPQPASESSQRGAAAPRFSLTAIIAGDWLWLEELAGMPLTREQVQLVQSMAQALLLSRQAGDDATTSVVRPGAIRPDAARPDVTQFDWPIHTNSQLDLSDEAAQASVAGFVSRRIEQYGCRGLVLLGQACALRVPMLELGIPVVSTASSAELLARPELKRQVWRDLQPLLRGDRGCGAHG
jgi:hypothetical protein